MAKWTQPSSPPPPLFVGQAERNFVKQINDELIERVVGQQVLYLPIDMETTNYHKLYGEALKKTFLPPVRAYALVEYNGSNRVQEQYGFDNVYNITIHFHKRRLTEDQDLFVREGDFLLYGSFHYEIVTLNEPRQIFGQVDHKMQITATCIRARKGLFDAS